MKFAERNTILVKEFDRYVLEYPEFADKIPENALVVMQVEGDDEFDHWAGETSLNITDKDIPKRSINISL